VCTVILQLPDADANHFRRLKMVKIEQVFGKISLGEPRGAVRRRCGLLLAGQGPPRQSCSPGTSPVGASSSN
jgi:hypothetical protein